MKRLSAELDQSLKVEGALTNDLEQIQLWLLEVNKQAIPKLQAQLTSYQTLKQELQTQISKSQELLQNQEKPDLVALTQEVQTGQESYDTQLAQVSVMEKGLKDAKLPTRQPKPFKTAIKRPLRPTKNSVIW